MMTMKDDKTPQMATKTYTYGGRVADGSMEKPEKREMQEGGGMVMKPREPYTTKEKVKEDREKAMASMRRVPILRMIG